MHRERTFRTTPALAEIVGDGPLTLPEISDRFWRYVTVRGHDHRVSEVLCTTRPLQGPRVTQHAAACLALHLRPS